MLLNSQSDPMGLAIADYFAHKKATPITVSTNVTVADKMPVSYLFRTEPEMPALERIALKSCRGRVLDAGAAAGAHALVLQDAGFEVTAIDISNLAVETMQKRGVNDARLADFFDYSQGTYDTLLFLMNGIGICGLLENLPRFFNRCRALLNAGGQILLDSSDLIYLYTDDDGSVLYDLNGSYYGELTYKMTYKTVKGQPFKWLFIDFDLLTEKAAENGFKCELLANGDHYDYLARLSLK